jgi:hypothetical protein
MAFFPSNYEAVKLREAESYYLKETAKQYRQLKDRLDWDVDLDRNAAKLYADLAYDEGFRIQQVLRCSYGEFMRFMDGEVWYSEWLGGFYESRQHKPSDAFHRMHGVGMRERMAFRQHGIEKKDKANCPKQVWREHKKFKKDKYKWGSRHYNAGPYNKKMLHKRNRQFVRQQLHHERYDRISERHQDIVRQWWD